MKNMTNIYQKRTNVRDAFSLSDPVRVKGKNILVIDDLYDSGCTLNEITGLLNRRGANKVFVLTLTKTIHSD